MYLMYYVDDAGVRVYTMEVRTPTRANMHARTQYSPLSLWLVLHRLRVPPPLPSLSAFP